MISADCKIYCTSNITLQVFRKKIASFIESDKIELSFISSDFYELSVRINDEFDKNRQLSFPDGFLYFQFIIDVIFNSDTVIDKCKDEMSKLLRWLWEIGIPSIASCDYEDSLPEKGGYKSKLIPWPSK